MGLLKIKERGGSPDRRFKQALRKAEDALEEIHQLSDDMEEEFSSRDGGGYSSRNDYDERDGYSSRSGYYHRDDRMDERRSRDSRGRYD